MSEKPKPSPAPPGGISKDDKQLDDAMVNDAFGTVDPADSTGLDEEKETGDAKARNKDTRED